MTHDEWQHILHYHETGLRLTHAEQGQLIGVVKQQNEVLKFYADENNWRQIDHYSSPSLDFPAWTEQSIAQRDYGALALKALAPFEETP